MILVSVLVLQAAGGVPRVKDTYGKFVGVSLVYSVFPHYVTVKWQGAGENLNS